LFRIQPFTGDFNDNVLHLTVLIIIDLSVISKESIDSGPPPPFFIFDLKRIALVVTRDLRITGEVDDTFIGDLNTYFDFAKFTKA
jgi:hypothetical protein